MSPLYFLPLESKIHQMKKAGILGSGIVAKVLATGFIKHGYEVMLGTRDVSKLAEWQKQNPQGNGFDFFLPTVLTLWSRLHTVVQDGNSTLLSVHESEEFYFRLLP